MTTPNLTIKPKVNSSSSAVRQNQQQSLLNHLKRIKFSEIRIIELKKLKNQGIKDFAFKLSQLQAILFLFPKLDRFAALKLLVKCFDIKLAMLSETEIKGLTSCLLSDPAFSNLLPFAKKNFGGIFIEERNKEKAVPLVQKGISSINAKLKDTPFDLGSKLSHLPKKKIVFEKKFFSLKQLRIAIIKLNPESRLNFFRQSAIKDNYQRKMMHMPVEDFKNFLELFPPSDAIKFLNLPLIREQIEGLRGQKGQLSIESYVDLLRYFEAYQLTAVKKLLRPISPTININITMKETTRSDFNVVARPLFFKNPIYDFNQDSRLSSSEDEGYRSGNVSPQI